MTSEGNSTISSVICYAGYTFSGIATLSALFAYHMRQKLKPRSNWTNSIQLTGKNIIITGGNSGIGAATAKELAKRKANVIIACRTRNTAEQVITEVKRELPKTQISYQHLDLSSLSSVKKFTEYLSVDNVDILINNAAVWGNPECVSCENLEQTFATNYLAHFYLSQLMLYKYDIKKIINVSSGLYTSGKIDPDNLHQLLDVPPIMNPAAYKQLYSNSKLAQIYQTKEMALKHPNTVSVAVHPGLCYTNLARYVKPTNIFITLLLKLFSPLLPMVMRTAEEGAQTAVYCCAEDVISGEYYGDCMREELKDIAKSEMVQKRLWEFSEQCLEKYADHK